MLSLQPVEHCQPLLGLLEFACGAVVSLGMSWDVFRHGNHPIELHGTAGSLRLPDPDTFGGTVAVSREGAEWEEMPTDDTLHGRRNWPFAAPDRANYRMLGVADMAHAIATGTTPRASGDLALHVLETMEAILEAGKSGRAVTVPDGAARAPALTEAAAAALQANA